MRPRIGLGGGVALRHRQKYAQHRPMLRTGRFIYFLSFSSDNMAGYNENHVLKSFIMFMTDSISGSFRL